MGTRAGQVPGEYPDFDDVQLDVRIEDWISSLGDEIQNRLGIEGGKHTTPSSNSAAASAVLHLCCVA